MRVTVPLAIIGLVAAVSYAVMAQPEQKQRLDNADAPVQTEIEGTPAPVNSAPLSANSGTASPRPPVDESALRFFARQGDTERMQREIERLRALYPGWEPPIDPLAPVSTPDADIARFWQLFQQGEYAATRAAIATRQAADPNFTPDPELIGLLDLAETQQRFTNASDIKQYDTVITLAANTSGLLTCDRIDNLWRLADAFVATNAKDRALDAYKYVLTNCTQPTERLATMQKAQAVFSAAELAPLFALETKAADGTGEFASLRFDVIRDAISTALDDNGQTPVPAADLAEFESASLAADAAEDLRLIGYYKLDRGRANEARRLFLAAFDADKSAASAEALGVALLQLRDYREAEAVLAPYSQETEDLTALYLDAAAAVLSSEPRVVLTGDELGRIVDATSSARDANTAQELGWYARAFEQTSTAFEWFTLALRWQPDLEPAAYGLLISADALGDAATFDAVMAQWANRSQRIKIYPQTNATSGVSSSSGTQVTMPEPRPANLTTSVTAQRAQAAQPARSSATGSGSASAATGGSTAARSCQNAVPPASLSANAALGQAWCLMQLNRPAQAAEHFARALQSGSEATRSDAAYGQSLAYVRMGLPDNAAVAAAAAPLSKARAVELEIAILTQKAQTAYAAADYIKSLEFLNLRSQYAPERNDLMTLRAWNYFHLKYYAEARRIFAAVALTGYGDAAAGLAATEQAMIVY